MRGADLIPEGQLWCLDPGHARSLFARLDRAGELPTQRQLDEYRRDRAAGLRQRRGAVAVLPLTGVLERRQTMLGYLGGTDLSDAEEALSAAVADPGVETVMLLVSSPGGTSYGTPEFADAVRAAGKRKRVVAQVDPLCASAAYWISSAASEIVATPSADVGSIGVYMMHVDYSDHLDGHGIRVTMVKSGKYKAELSPYQRLSAEARDYLQGECDDCYRQFVSAVARGRGKTADIVASTFGEGRVMSAPRAKAVGMIDRIGTPTETLGRLMGGSSASSSGRRSSIETSMEQLRRRHEMDRIRSGTSSGRAASDDVGWRTI